MNTAVARMEYGKTYDKAKAYVIISAVPVFHTGYGYL